MNMTVQTNSDAVSDDVMMPNPTAAANESSETNARSIVSYWPLLLVTFGGLLGLFLGGIAAAVNTQVMKSGLPKLVKYPLVLSTGLIALATWFVLLMILHEVSES